MKHLKLSLIVLGVILVFSGCTHVVNVPQIPELIVPEDGAVFEAEPPTFIWTSDSLFLADAYIIIILKDSLRSEDTLVYETLEDTTYTMPPDIFNSADSGTYCWVAAVHWIDGNVETTAHGDPRTFVIKKPEEPQGLDLNTTYFPFGRGYEWTYERHCWEHSDENDWDKYDTFTIRVVDSIFRDDSLIFKLEGGWFQFLDSQVKIWKANKLEIWQFYWKVDTINVAYPQPESLYYKDLGGILGVELFKLGYNVDTLVFYQGEDYGNYGSSRMEKHLKKIGVVYQGVSNWWVGSSGCGNTGTMDSLILFTAPEGQRYP